MKIAKIYCNNCEGSNPEGTVFCKNCGDKISENAQDDVDCSEDAVTGSFIIVVIGISLVGGGGILSLFGPLLIIGVPLIFIGLIVMAVGIGGTGITIINWIFKSGKKKK